MPEKTINVNDMVIMALVAVLVFTYPSLTEPLKLFGQVLLILSIGWIIHGKKSHREEIELKGYKMMISAYLQSISVVIALFIKAVILSLPRHSAPIEVWTFLQV